MIARECLQKIDALGIPRASDEDLEFKWNGRLKRRWGQCQPKQGRYIISLNIVFQDESNDIRGLETTLIHEILHTCDFRDSHGSQWQAFANQINDAYGYNVQEFNDEEELGIVNRFNLTKAQLEEREWLRLMEKYHIRG